MRSVRGRPVYCSDQRAVLFRQGLPAPQNLVCRPVAPWVFCPRVRFSGFGVPTPPNYQLPLNVTHRINSIPLPLVREHTPIAQRVTCARPKTKTVFVRSRFRHHRRRGRSATKSSLNPSDPLNLQDLMKETERRRVEGLSPLRGDSRLNTPAVSTAGDIGYESPLVSTLNISTTPKIDGECSTKAKQNKSGPSLSTRYHMFRRQKRGSRARRRVPITGNYGNYYVRRDPNDRLPYLMPEWFVGKDVADYGCHNGTLTFGVLERFPDVRKIDAFDCDVELIANAKSMQRERLRWDTGSSVQYDKITFQVANWIDSYSGQDEPEYDTIMAFSVTKWIHLNHGDAGLLRFFRRAFNLLKPGGHLILEPQPKSSYRKTRFTSRHRSMYQSMKIDPSNLEPVLVDLGFSYFDTIKVPGPNEPFKRKIILCSKSYGATPASIRNDFRSEVQVWDGGFHSSVSPVNREPPPVCYNPQTPIYTVETPVNPSESPFSHNQQTQISSAVTEVSPIAIVPSESKDTFPDSQCEPDSTSVV